MATGIDQLIAGLLGVAFGARAFDSRRPLWSRAAYGAVGVDMLRSAFGPEPEPLLGRSELGKARQSVSFATASTGASTVPLKFEETRVKNIGERVARIHEQMVTGTRDPRVYSLARSVLNRKCGGEWCVPERDAKGEVAALFQEVRSRVRYTWDPVDYDAFATPRKTLELGTGDCDDSWALLGSMLRTIGYHVRSRVVHTKGFSTWNHIYGLVKMPNGEWMALDPTVNKPPGWQVPEESMLRPPKDFDVAEKGEPPRIAGDS